MVTVVVIIIVVLVTIVVELCFVLLQYCWNLNVLYYRFELKSKECADEI